MAFVRVASFRYVKDEMAQTSHHSYCCPCEVKASQKHKICIIRHKLDITVNTYYESGMPMMSNCDRLITYLLKTNAD